MKKRMLKLAACAMLFGFVSAGSGGWSLSGSIAVKEEGTVYLSLVDETGFREGYRPVRRVAFTVGAEELKRGRVEFRMDNIPTGEYTFSAFLDRNGNGKLDIGLLGPTEPWGNYRLSRPAMRGPKWEEVSFTVKGDQSDIRIVIE